MARQVPEAERLRQCRLVFQRAVQDRVSMDAARTSMSLERIRERQGRIEALRDRASPGGETASADFIDQVAAGRRADPAPTVVYARTCALLGEHDGSDDA